jgi:hypothetical protein
MRIYIISNDGITLCRAAPATVNDDEVAVASKEELHAAPLSGKRLRCRKAEEARRSRGPDRSAVAGNRGLARPGIGARRKTAVKAGRGDCNAAATRGRNRG